LEVEALCLSTKPGAQALDSFALLPVVLPWFRPSLSVLPCPEAGALFCLQRLMQQVPASFSLVLLIVALKESLA
jgi:hypothetical protein